MNLKFKYLAIVLLIFSNGLYANANRPCLPPTASIEIDVNNIRAKLLNGGDMFWNIFDSRDAAYEIPKNSGKHSSFASSIFLAAIDAGNNLYGAGQTYRQRGLDFWPGSLNALGEIDSVDCVVGDKMYTVYGSEIIDAKLGKGISYNMSRWGNTKFPFFDKNNDGIYDPSLGDYPVLDINNPSLIPGQMVSWVFNDKGNVHTAYPGGNPLGVEIQATAYAFTSNTSLIVHNSTIFRYVIINKSNTTYTEFRFGKYEDFDLGGAADDYVGCDLSTNTNGAKRNLFFVYNADNLDEDISGIKGYGIAPPAYGVSFLNPGKNSDGSALEMHSFLGITDTFIPGTGFDPLHVIILHRYLSGLWEDGTASYYGTPTGKNGTDPCLFMFPGNTDPQGRPNWVETIPGGVDRRSIIAVKPRTLAPGEQMKVELAYVWARDTPGTNLTSLAKLRLSTDTLIEAYRTNFNNFSTGITRTKNNLAQVLIYPNPTNSYITIDGVGLVNDLKIYNAQGKLVLHLKKPLSTKVDIEDLPQGSYLVKTDEYVGRFVKL
jgi:Secretion system C-terminal sorting domain